MVTLVIGIGGACSSSNGADAVPGARFSCGNATCVIGESYCRHSSGGAGGAGGNGASNPVPATDECVPFAGCAPHTCACTSCTTCTETAAGAVTATCLGV
jgi:hypothetical protein